MLTSKFWSCWEKQLFKYLFCPRQTPIPKHLPSCLPNALRSFSRTCTRTSGHYLGTFKAGSIFVFPVKWSLWLPTSTPSSLYLSPYHSSSETGCFGRYFPNENGTEEGVEGDKAPEEITQRKKGSGGWNDFPWSYQCTFHWRFISCGQTNRHFFNLRLWSEAVTTDQ